MALTIKNADVERLAAEVAALANETKTEAIRRALEERKQRLALRTGAAGKRPRIENFLQNRVWPLVPAGVIGRRISRREHERILGYGPHGV